MTVSAQTPYISYSYNGPGAYSFTFKVRSTSDLLIQHIDTDGTVSDLAYGSHYSVGFTEGVDGGEVTTTYPTGSTGKLIIRRNITPTQEVDFVNNSPLPAELLEDAFDLLTMLIQQLETTVNESQVAIDWRGDWTSSIAYSVRDVVTGPDTNIYICDNAHTSGTFATDLVAGYWNLVVDVSGATDAAAAALISEANAGASEDNAANCAGSAFTSAANASASAAAALSYKNAAEVAKNQAIEYATTRTQYILGTSGSIALNPDNGSHQICDASGTVTFTDSLDDEQWLILQIRRNSQTINWPTITWMRNTAPTLDATYWERLELWKVGSTLYGAIY